MATDFVCGFECRILGGGGAAVPDERHWDTVGAATPTISTTVVRNGTAALRTTAAASLSNLGKVVATRTMAGRLYFRFASLNASGTPFFIRFANASGNLGFQVSSAGAVTAQAGAGAASTSLGTVSVNTWYRLDWLADTTSGTASLKGRLDGGTEQTSTATQAAADMTQLLLGNIASTTWDVYFDDVITGNASGDYPYGEGSVQRYKPSRDGTHSFVLNDFKYENSGSIATNATDVYTHVDDDDLSSTTDFISQNVTGAKYVEVGFTAPPPINQDALAVNVVTSWHASATGANTIGLKMVDGASTKQMLDEAGDSLSDFSNLTSTYSEKVLTAPPSGGTWTPAKLSGLLFQMGFSTDVVGIPFWDGLMLEVAYGPQVVLPAAASLTVTGDTPTVTVASTGTTVTPVAASLTLTSSAPAIVNPVGVAPAAASLTSSLSTPAVALPVATAPSAASLATGASAPTVAVTNNVTITPSAASLTTTASAPAVVTPVTVAPSPASLTTSTSAPTLATGVTPTATSLTLAASAPALSLPVSVQPTAAPLATTASAPTVAATDNKVALPAAASLSTSLSAPDVAATAHQTIIPAAAALATTLQAPAVTTGDAVQITPGAGSLALTASAPAVEAIAAVVVLPTPAPLLTAPAAPSVTATANKVVIPSPRALHFTMARPVIPTKKRRGRPGDYQELPLPVVVKPPRPKPLRHDVWVQPVPAFMSLIPYRPRVETTYFNEERDLFLVGIL